MKSIFFRLIVGMGCCFFNVQASATELNSFNPKNYVYDEEGNPLFVKVYLGSANQHRNEKVLSSPANGLVILKRMAQEDKEGSFIAVPIYKKKKNNEDENDDESNWECPYCYTINPASRNTCKNPDCPLHRKGGRDW